MTTILTPRVEYDDGLPANHPKRSKNSVAKDRKCGFYLQVEGKEFPIPVGYMRVSEREPFAQMISDLLSSLTKIPSSPVV